MAQLLVGRYRVLRSVQSPAERTESCGAESNHCSDMWPVSREGIFCLTGSHIICDSLIAGKRTFSTLRSAGASSFLFSDWELAGACGARHQYEGELLGKSVGACVAGASMGKGFWGSLEVPAEQARIVASSQEEFVV